MVNTQTIKKRRLQPNSHTPTRDSMLPSAFSKDLYPPARYPRKSSESRQVRSTGNINKCQFKNYNMCLLIMKTFYIVVIGARMLAASSLASIHFQASCKFKVLTILKYHILGYTVVQKLEILQYFLH